MAEARVGIQITVDDKGSPVIRRIQSDLKGLEQQAKRAGATLKSELEDKFAAFAGRAGTIGTALQRMGGSLGSATTTLGKFAVGFGVAATGVGLLAAVLTPFIASAARAATGLQQMAAQAGVTVERFQSLAAALRRAAIEPQMLANGLAILGVNLGRARQGSGELVTALKATDRVFLEMLRRTGSAEVAFDLLVKRIAAMKDPTDQARLAAAAFGDDFARRVLPVIRQGPKALAELEQKARDSGQVLSQYLVTNGVKADIALANLSATIKGNLQRVLLALAPVLTGIANAFAFVAEKAAAAFAAIGRFAGVSKFFQDPRLAAIDEELTQLPNKFRLAGPSTGLRGTVDLEARRKELLALREKLQADVNRNAFGAIGLDPAAGVPPPLALDKPGGGGDDSAVRHFEELRRKVAELRGEITPTQAAVEDILASFKNSTPEVRSLAEEYVRLKNGQEQFVTETKEQLAQLKEPTTASIAGLRKLVETISKRPDAAGLEDLLKDVNKQLRDVTREAIEAGNALQNKLTSRLEDLLDPAAAARREFRDFREEAKLLGRTDLLPLVDQIERVQKASEVLGSVFGELQRGIADVFEGLILGTSKVEDAFKQMGIAIIRSLTELLVSAAVKQLTALLLGAVAGAGGGAGVQGVDLSGLLLGGATSLTLGGGGGNAALFNALLGGGSSRAGLTGGSGSAGGGIPNTGGIGSLFSQWLTGGSALPNGATAVAGGQASPLAGGASSGISLAGVVALVASLAVAAKGLYDDRKANRAVTLGAAGSNAPRNRLTGVQAGLIIATTIGGAAVGSVVPIIGTAIGAAVGAAIGAAAATAIAKAVNSGISSSVRRGATQEELNEKVVGKLKSDPILLVLGGPGAIVTPDWAAPLLTPNIELIFAKIFREVLGKAGLNTAGIDQDRPGGGLGARAKALITDEAKSEAGLLSQLIGLAIGAGSEGKNRQSRLVNLLLGGSARKAQSEGADLEAILYRVFVRVFGGRLGLAFRTLNNAFPMRNERSDELRGALGRAFQASYGGLNIDGIIEAMRSVAAEIKGAFSKKALKAGRGAASEAAGELFNADPEAGAANFARKLLGAASQALQQGIGKAIGKLFEVAMAPVFREITRSLRRALEEGISEVGPELQRKLRRSLEVLEQFVSDPKFFETLAEWVALQRQLDEGLRDAAIRGAVKRGDPLEAQRLIKDQLAEEIGLVNGFGDLIDNIEIRIARALGRIGDGDRETTVLKRRADEAREELLTGAGVGSLEDLPGSKLEENLPRALELLSAYADAQITYLEQSLALAQQQKAVFQGLADSFQDVVDVVTVFRGGRKGQESLLNRDLALARELLPKALAGDLEAATQLRELLPRIFASATNQFAPGSPLLGGILDFVTTASTQLTEKFGTLAKEETAKIEQLRSELETFHNLVIYIELLKGMAQKELDKKFQEIVDRLGTEGPLYKIFEDIARQLGVPIDWLRDNVPGDNPYAGEHETEHREPTGAKDPSGKDGPVGHDKTTRPGAEHSPFVRVANPPTLYGRAVLPETADDTAQLLRDLLTRQDQWRASQELLLRELIGEVADQGATATPLPGLPGMPATTGVTPLPTLDELAGQLGRGLAQRRFPSLRIEIQRTARGG